MKHNKAFQDLQNNDGLQFMKTTTYGSPKSKVPDLNIEKFMKPKLSKEQKINRQKLDALNHPEALMMLVDFLKENYDIYGDPENPLMTNHIVNRVVNITARLKVQYMNNITPIAENVQMDIVDEINKQNK